MGIAGERMVQADSPGAGMGTVHAVRSANSQLAWLPPLAFCAAFGWLGVLCGHVLTYDLLSMHPSGGDSMHAWLNFAGVASPVLVVVATIMIIAFTVRASDHMAQWLQRRARGMRMLHGSLVAAVVYVLIEFGERIVVHQPPPVFHELAFGVVVQALVAAFVVFLVWWMARLTLAIVELLHAARALAATAAGRAVRSAATWIFSADMRRRLTTSGSLVGRAPPVPS